MIKVKFNGLTEMIPVTFIRPGEHIVTLIGEVPTTEVGFCTYRMDGKTQLGDFSNYSTVYRVLSDGCQYSDNGSVWQEPEEEPIALNIDIDESRPKSTFEMLVEAYEAIKPPKKIGYDTVLVGDAGVIAWTYVKNDEAIPGGTYLNPMPWEPGMPIVAGVSSVYEEDGWYVFDDLPKRCIKDGAPESFDDTEYWEDLGI